MRYKTILGKTVELTIERKLHILTSHPDMKFHLVKLQQVFTLPDAIRRSRIDNDVLLFYKYFANIKGGKYIVITVKTGQRNFVLTAYLTDKIRAGELYEEEKESF